MTVNYMEVARFYDKAAEGYDEEFAQEEFIAEDRRVGRLLLRELYGKVLDIGCGTGNFSWLFREYTGIDVSEQSLRMAQARNEGGEFIRADFHRLPFPDNSFDCAMSIYGGLSYLESPEQVAEEIARVTRDRFVLFFYTPEYVERGVYTHEVNGGEELITYAPERRELRRLFSEHGVVKVFGLTEINGGEHRYNIVSGRKHGRGKV